MLFCFINFIEKVEFVFPCEMLAHSRAAGAAHVGGEFGVVVKAAHRGGETGDRAVP